MNSIFIFYKKRIINHRFLIILFFEKFSYILTHYTSRDAGKNGLLTDNIDESIQMPISQPLQLCFQKLKKISTCCLIWSKNIVDHFAKFILMLKSLKDEIRMHVSLHSWLDSYWRRNLKMNVEYTTGHLYIMCKFPPLLQNIMSRLALCV